MLKKNNSKQAVFSTLDLLSKFCPFFRPLWSGLQDFENAHVPRDLPITSPEGFSLFYFKAKALSSNGKKLNSVGNQD